MTPTTRAILGCTHLAVIGLGVALGLRGTPQREIPPLPLKTATPVSEPAPEQAADTSGREDFQPVPLSPADHAATWDSLKGKFLPRKDRLHLAGDILEDWSLVDLPAAVRAVFGETSDEGPDSGMPGNLSLLDRCGPGILADPLKAWELVRANSFGLETGRFRRAWLDCVIKSDVALVISILGELPRTDRGSTLHVLAEAASVDDDLAKRQLIWTHFKSLPDTPAEQYFLTQIGETLCYYAPLDEVVARLSDNPTPAERRICIRALSLALFEVIGREEIPGLLQSLPTAERGEVAAAGMRHAGRDGKLAFTLANVALDNGNLDALQTAGTDQDFSDQAKRMEHPTGFFGENPESRKLVDWAFRLPDDPRTLEIFSKTISGIICPTNSNLIHEKLEALPAGPRKEQGMAIIAREEERQRAEEAEDAEEEPEEE